MKVLQCQIWKWFRCAAIILTLIAIVPPGIFGGDWIAKAWTAPHAPLGPLTDLALSQDGFLLVASGEGLRRFDGLTFSDRLEPGPDGSAGWQATAVFVARNGDVWIGYRGEGVEHRTAGQSKHYGVGEHGALRFVRAFWEDPKGGIWIGSEGGLTLIQSGRVIPQPLPPGQAVYRVRAGSAGALRLATDIGLYDFREGRYAPIATRAQLEDSRVRDFETDATGVLWIATMGGVARFHDGQRKFFTKTNGLAGDWVRRLVFDQNGSLWAACQGGVSRWTGSEFKSLGDVLEKKPEVTAFVPGSAGEYWLSTSSGELVSLRPASFALLPNSADPGNSHLLAVTEDLAGNLWFGWNYFGLAEHAGVERHIHAHLGDRPLNRPIALSPAQAGGVWCTGSDSRLFRADQGKMSFERIPGWGESTPMSAVLEARDGTLWVGSSDHGLAAKRGEQWTFYDKSSGLLGNRIHALHQDLNGTIWVAADNLYRWDSGRFSPWNPNARTTFGEIICLQDDQARDLWVGTQGNGLFRISGNKSQHYTRLHRLMEETVHGIIFDDQDRIWLQGPRGVTRVRRSELSELDKGERTELTPDYWSFAEQGANTGTGTRHPTSTRLRDGRILFATTGGAAVFKSDAAPHAAGRTTVSLEKILLDGESVARNGLVRIPAGMRRLLIRWSAVNLAHPESLRFRHRLTGLDSEWLEDGTLREAHYGTLPKGEYRFELQVRDLGRTWRPGIPPLAFQQLPQWHERWSIRLLSAVALFLGWWLIHLWQVRQLARQFRIVEAERHRIAGELHDTVEQGLAGIAINLDAASRQLRRAPVQAEKFLSSARRLVIRSRDEARQAIWEMHSAHFKTELIEQIRHAARDLVGGTGMKFETALEGKIPALPDDVTRRLLRIVLEALTNAAKHSRATRLEIRLTSTKERLVVCISDDGCGFETEGQTEPNHYGLEFMRARAEQLDGTLEIISTPSRGTTVTFALPIAPRRPPVKNELEIGKESHVSHKNSHR